MLAECAADVSMNWHAVQDAKRLMPDTDPVQLLRVNPDIVMQLVKGKK